MPEDYYKLDPPARFGTVVPQGERSAPVRLFVADQGVAAVLDGLAIEDNQDLLHLLGIAISAITGPLHADADMSDTGFDRDEFPTEIGVLGGRLPLAAEVMAALRSGPGRSEEAEFRIEAMITGIPDSLRVTKAEKRQLLKTIPRIEVRDEEERAELNLILSDLERGRTLRSLPVPQQFYWFNCIMEEIRGKGWSNVYGASSKQEEARVRAEHETVRNMWGRFRVEVRQHGRA